jgi:hypothetical protein
MAPPTLTLHQGDAQEDYVEHPTEIARRALIAAAEVEVEGWPGLLLRVARALPSRAPLRAREGGA